MKQNPAKVKFIIFISILALVGLIVLNTYLIISINKKNAQLNEQQNIIQQQEELLDFYENQNN